jgi:aminoglycoside 3-N-acetyltransferase
MKMAVSQARSKLYYLVRCLLSQQRRTALKNSLAKFRKRLRWAYLLVYGSFTAKELVDEIRKAVKDDFEILMVHSAWDRLLPMYVGTPQELIDELVAFCGEGRTLAMPAFFLGGRSYGSKEYYRSHVFDARRTVSEMGLLTEVFRRTPGVKRSLHPTHSICALGPLADELTATHHLGSTRTGTLTPFETMTRRRTAILGLGVEYYRSLAHTHTAEDSLGGAFPIAFEKETLPVTLIDQQGKTLPYDLTFLRTSRTLDNTLLRTLLGPEELVEWSFHGAALFLTYAHRVTQSLVDAAHNGVTVYGSPAPR